MTTGQYTIVPLALKSSRLEIDFSQLFWGNLHSRWITPGVKPGLDAKPRRRTSDQIDNRLMAYQRSASPILRDKGKHSVLNLVPLACARREVTDLDAQSRPIRQTLTADFPQARATAVATPCVRQDQQFLGLGVGSPPHLFPPGKDAVDGKIRYCLQRHICRRE